MSPRNSRAEVDSSGSESDGDDADLEQEEPADGFKDLAEDMT
jgi:hypothetical protein